jgi:hypothetical protein
MRVRYPGYSPEVDPNAIDLSAPEDFSLGTTPEPVVAPSSRPDPMEVLSSLAQAAPVPTQYTPEVPEETAAPRRSFLDRITTARDANPEPVELATGYEPMAQPTGYQRRPKGLVDVLMPLVAAVAKNRGVNTTPYENWKSQQHYNDQLDLEAAKFNEQAQARQYERQAEERRKGIYAQSATDLLSNLPEKYSYVKPFAETSLKAGDVEQAYKILLETLGGGSGGGLSGWKMKNEQYDVISAMEPGPERDNAVREWQMRWATSTALGMSPEYREAKAAQAAANTTARIGAESGMADVSAETAAKKASGSKRGAVAGAYDAAAKGMYSVTGPDATRLGTAVMAIDAMNTMADRIDSGDVGFFSLTGVGKFTNPEANKRFQVINEYYARPLSGAAINAKEWSQFKREVLDKWDTLTPEGRKAASVRLREIARSNAQAGAIITKDDKWIGRIRDAGTPDFGSEEEARAAGYGNGDKVRINGTRGTLR